MSSLQMLTPHYRTPPPPSEVLRYDVDVGLGGGIIISSNKGNLLAKVFKIVHTE